MSVIIHILSRFKTGFYPTLAPREPILTYDLTYLLIFKMLRPFSSISPVGETAQGTPLHDQEVVRLHHNLVVGLGASLPLN
ncbi:hypothetical protein, partial [Clostridium perfringens]